MQIIHSPHSRRDDDMWVHQKSSQSRHCRHWEVVVRKGVRAPGRRLPRASSVCFSHRKKERTAKKDGGEKRRRRVTVVSHFREILNCELRKRRERKREKERDRAGEYRRDMHYTMDARFSRLISLNSTVPPPFPRGIARYRSRKSNLRKYTHARDAVQRTRRHV